MVMADNGKAFLLMQKSKGAHKGQYVPVGGHIEPYETPLQAALRETKEESGLVLSGLRLCGILTETSPVKFNYTIYCYHARVPQETLAKSADAEGALEWIAYEQLNQTLMPPTDLIIYRDVQAGRFFVYDVLYDKDLNMLRMTDELTGRVVAGNPMS